jgi:NADH-quinone oxidoreductase subunit J
MIEVGFFIFFSLMAIGSALSVILQKNPIYSALSLIFVIASIGGLFLLLQAAFLAVLQIIIYAGAIMALFLFVIMMVDVEKDLNPSWNPKSIGVLVILLMIAASTMWAVSSYALSFQKLGADFTIRNLARELFTSYVFPFEAIALLIVSSVVGALYVARKEQT